ncbi:MAG TPA: aspartate/glutamate racemase family protein [Chloroflexota bacterium]|nr:aspartate/glutamate racemase family protein [Chloroflexota bacterium]
MVDVQSPSRPFELIYQSFGQKAGMGEYQAALQEIVSRAVGPDAQITVASLDSALIEGKGYASAQSLELPALLAAIATSADRGVDAIAIGNGFDPGLWESRELIDIPVLGFFETVAFFGLRVGWKLGVLCSSESGPARIEEVAARYGIAGRVVQPVAINVSVPEVMEAFRSKRSADEIVARCAEHAGHLARAGAEVAMIASGALDVFFTARRADSQLEIPILPGAMILAHELASAAALHRLGVPAVSRVGRFRTPPQAVHDRLRSPG